MGIYQELGVATIVNAYGTITRIGGSLMAPEVLEAMREASEAFVDIADLNRRAGQRIAALLGCQAACVVSGAAAGIAISAAACMTMGNAQKILQLPDTRGIPDEVLMLKCHRMGYDRALLLPGAKIIQLEGGPEDVGAALSEKTAMFFYVAQSEEVPGSIPLQEVQALMHIRGLPVVVDAAAELPPIANIARYFSLGADLLIFSGGKEIRGPQSAGLILGRKDLIECCLLNSCPNPSVGRPMKADKETIVGMLRAVELFVRQDEGEKMRRFERMVAEMLDGFAGVPGLSARRAFPKPPGVQPVTIPRAYVRAEGLTAQALLERLREGDPPVHAHAQGDELVLNPQCLKDEEVPVVIRAVLRAYDGAAAGCNGQT